MSPNSRTILLADDARFLEHVAPPDHPERGERLLAVREGLARARALGSGPGAGGEGFAYKHLPLTDASDEQLARVHAPQYIESLGRLAGKRGYVDDDTYLSEGSVAAARRAAGSAVALVDALVGEPSDQRFGIALPRPPGHHALADKAMGFCLLNNVAVAAAHARARGRERVLVLDWDVHHGNGTEAMFYDDPNVLFLSLHQYPNYPGTGAIGDSGAGEGVGRSVNVPLPPGASDAVYAAAFQRVVLPIVEQFAPDFALVSCGFDAHSRDPLAQMQLTAAAYAEMTNGLVGTLAPSCPLALVLEGGYDLVALAESSEAVAGALFGALLSPPPAASPNHQGAPLPSEHSHALHEIARQQANYWRL